MISATVIGLAVEDKDYYGNSHNTLIDQFYRVLESGEGSYISAEQGVVSIRMIEAIQKSSCTSRSVAWEDL